jgi:hypothetical protein
VKKILVLAAAAAMLSACSQQQVDECLQAANPIECAQVREAGGDVSDYLLYGMAGYMLGSAMSGGSKRPVIIQDPNYRGYRRPIASYSNSYRYVTSPSYKPYSQRVKVTTTTTKTKKSVFGGTKTKTTTRTTTSSYRSSGSSSFRSSGSSFRSSGSSFGGGRRR